MLSGVAENFCFFAKRKKFRHYKYYRENHVEKKIISPCYKLLTMSGVSGYSSYTKWGAGLLIVGIILLIIAAIAYFAGYTAYNAPQQLGGVGLGTSQNWWVYFLGGLGILLIIIGIIVLAVGATNVVAPPPGYLL